MHCFRALALGCVLAARRRWLGSAALLVATLLTLPFVFAAFLHPLAAQVG